jgi:hypothetical protein
MSGKRGLADYEAALIANLRGTAKAQNHGFH